MEDTKQEIVRRSACGSMVAKVPSFPLSLMELIVSIFLQYFLVQPGYCISKELPLKPPKSSQLDSGHFNCRGRHLGCITQLCSTVHMYSAVQQTAVNFSPMEFSAVQPIIVLCGSVQYSAVQRSAVQRSAVQCSAVQCSAVQCSAVQCSAVHCSVVQCINSQSQSNSI